MRGIRSRKRGCFPCPGDLTTKCCLPPFIIPTGPNPEQITGPAGPRLMPSALDVAAALGSKLAMTLLQDDLDRYPPLRTVLEELGKRRTKLSQETMPIGPLQ